MVLTNGLSTFPIKGNPIFSNDQSLPKNPPDCPILCNRVFDNITLAEWPFAKVLKGFESYVLVNKNLCGKLFSSLEPQKTFNEIFKVTSAPFFIANFNL